MFQLFFFLVLMVVSAAYCFFGALYAPGFVVLFLVWVLFAAFRLVWLGGGLFGDLQSRDSFDDAMPLAGRLVTGLSLRRDRDQCLMALRAFRYKTVIWIFLGGLYAAWLVFAYLMPDLPPNYVVLRSYIHEYFRAFGDGGDFVRYGDFPILLRSLGVVFMIGIAYVGALSFAYSRSLGTILLRASATLFLIFIALHCFMTGFVFENISFFHVLWTGHGPGHVVVLQSMDLIPSGTFSPQMARYYAYGFGADVFLYLLGLYMAGLFISALGRGRPYLLYALSGLVVLGILFLCDVYCAAAFSMVPVWIFGWVCLAVLSVRCKKSGT